MSARVEHHPAEQAGVVIPPDEEAEFEAMLVEADEDEAAGRCITWEQFLAERAIRRGR